MSNEYESAQDERLKENMRAFNDIFNDDEVLDIDDPLEETKDIKGVELEELKRLVSELRREVDEKPSNEKGKVLKKSLPNVSNDVDQIVSSFVSCFVLALVTASIGAGWLIYLINQINI